MFHCKRFIHIFFRKNGGNHRTRKFSGDTKSSATANEDLKFPGFYKYLAYAAPFIGFGSMAIWSINDARVRYFIERNISSHFVNFVRVYYGFDDEDLEKIKLIKDIIDEQNKKISIKISYQNEGEAKHFFDIPGDMKFSELHTLTPEKKHQNFRNIEFLDDKTEENQISTTEKFHFTLGPQSLVPYYRSEWDSDLIDFRSIHSLNFRLWFENVTLNRIDAFTRYLKYGNLDVHLVPYHTKKKISRQNLRREVMQTIEELQSCIVDFEIEKQRGQRNIDAIDADIKELSREILALRRKYLNMFHYF